MKQLQIQTSAQTKNNIFLRILIILIITVGIILVSQYYLKPRTVQLDPTKYIESNNIQLDTIKIDKVERFEKLKRKVSFKGITAKSVYALNPETGKVYYSKNSNIKLPIASVTKLVTALTAYNNLTTTEDLIISQKLPIMDNPIGLKVGDTIKINELLQCTLIASKNDCGNAFALDTNFVKSMNTVSGILNMKNSNFSNPTGFVNENNYSTSYDLGLISSAFVRNIELVSISDKTKERIDINGKAKRSVIVNATNIMLLENKNIKGLKTGFTYAAGECLVLYYDFGGSNKMITVVLGSKDRFKDSRLLYNYIIESYN